MNGPSIQCPTCGYDHLVSTVRPLNDGDMVQAAMLGGLGMAIASADRKEWLRCEHCGTLVRRQSQGRFAQFLSRLLWGDRGRSGAIIKPK